MDPVARANIPVLSLILASAFGIPTIYYGWEFWVFDHQVWTPALNCTVTQVLDPHDDLVVCRSLYQVHVFVPNASTPMEKQACVSVNADMHWGTDGDCVISGRSTVDAYPWKDGPTIPAAWTCSKGYKLYTAQRWTLPYTTSTCVYRNNQVLIDQDHPFVDWPRYEVFVSCAYILGFLPVTHLLLSLLTPNGHYQDLLFILHTVGQGIWVLVWLIYAGHTTFLILWSVALLLYFRFVIDAFVYGASIWLVLSCILCAAIALALAVTYRFLVLMAAFTFLFMSIALTYALICTWVEKRRQRLLHANNT